MTALAYDEKHRRVVAGCRDGAFRTWDLVQNRETTDISGHDGWVNRVCFTSCGEALVTGGEDGTMGDEERNIIAPAIADMRNEGLVVTGPHPADTLFHPAVRDRYDAVIAMYHDQALIPFKTIAFDHGVNVTLGLPFVRTSPDHGTAFDIAAQACASPQSLIESLCLAAQIAAARTASQPK